MVLLPWAGPLPLLSTQLRCDALLSRVHAWTPEPARFLLVPHWPRQGLSTSTPDRTELTPWSAFNVRADPGATFGPRKVVFIESKMPWTWLPALTPSWRVLLQRDGMVTAVPTRKGRQLLDSRDGLVMLSSSSCIILPLDCYIHIYSYNTMDIHTTVQALSHL